MKPSDKSKARSTSAAGSTTGAGSSFHQPEQSLGTQINVGHDAQIQLHGSSPVSLETLEARPVFADDRVQGLAIERKNRDKPDHIGRK